MSYKRATKFLCLVLFSKILFAQDSDLLKSISIDQDNDFAGYELLDITDQQLFVLAESWHNIQSVPSATLKILQYLHQHGNVRILAIEQGKSVAYMMNKYLETGDTTMLQHITRNTMFWGKENRQFLWQLRRFNESLPASERVLVRSIDIEYKMESAVFVINQFINGKTIPEALRATVGEFERIYEETKSHREQFDGLSIMFYYDQDQMQQLLINTINDLEKNSESYIDFFGDDFTQFATMILEMDDGLNFDYTNPNTNYKFRDRIIYQNFETLVDENPDVGILCVIGQRHAMKGSSISDLNMNEDSPLTSKVMIIRVSALYNKAINSGDLRRINYNFPKQLKEHQATLIKHAESDPNLRSKKGLDYTLFINASGNLTPYENVLTEEY